MSSSGSSAIRELLRRAGTILAQISDGRILGIRLGEDGPELVTGSGVRRGIEPAESAAVSAALHLALWLRDRERLGPGRALLLWEIHEPGASELAEALLELLYDAGTESDRIVCVVPPQVMDRAPERFPVAFEVAEDDGGRRSVRTLRGGHPVISLSPGV
jgi:hypothetical protein